MLGLRVSEQMEWNNKVYGPANLNDLGNNR